MNDDDTPFPEEEDGEIRNGDDILDLEDDYDINEFDKLVAGEQDGTHEATENAQDGETSVFTNTEDTTTRENDEAAIMQNNGRPNTDTPTTENHDGATKPRPQHDDKPVPIQTTTNNNNNHLELILQELRNVSGDVSSLKRKHDSLEKKVAKSLTVKKPSPKISIFRRKLQFFTRFSKKLLDFLSFDPIFPKMDDNFWT